MKVVILAGGLGTRISEESHLKPKPMVEIGDISDLEHLKAVFDRVQPEIVIRMAAQPIVRESCKNPVYTYETNVMGMGIS